MVIDLEYCRKLDTDDKTEWPNYMNQDLLHSQKLPSWSKFNDICQVKEMIKVAVDENHFKNDETYQKWFSELNNKLNNTKKKENNNKYI